jgi:hypothetical protein
MTDTRITANQTVEWRFCPWCGRKLELDQDLDLLVYTPDGIDVEASEANGYNFEQSAKHCGYHIRLWVPAYEEATIEV